MALFDRFWKGSRSGAPDGAGAPAGFFPLYESTRPLDDDDDDLADDDEDEDEGYSSGRGGRRTSFDSDDY